MRRLSTALTAAVTLSLLPLGAAAAGEYVHDDQPGDVRTFAAAEDSFVPAPGVANGDVLRTRVVHTKRDVAIRVKFRQLRQWGEFRLDFIRLVTNEGVRRDVSVTATRRQWRGAHEMRKLNGAPVECTLSHFINYDTEVVMVRVPRSCLSAPRWVRVGMGAIWQRGEDLYVDDAFLDNNVRDRGPALSPRIRRG